MLFPLVVDYDVVFIIKSKFLKACYIHVHYKREIIAHIVELLCWWRVGSWWHNKPSLGLFGLPMSPRSVSHRPKHA